MSLLRYLKRSLFLNLIKNSVLTDGQCGLNPFLTEAVMKGLNRCKKYCLPMPSHCRCIDCKSHIIANCILMSFKSYNWPIKSIKSSKKFQVTKFYESHVIIDVLCMYQWNYFEHIIYSINYFKQTEPSEKNIFKKI